MQPLTRSGIEVPRGNDGIVVGDFNGDGVTEILITDNKKRLYTLVKTDSGYEQQWYYPGDPVPGGFISSIGAAELDGRAGDELIVAGTPYITNGPCRIAILDGVSREEVHAAVDDAGVSSYSQGVDMTVKDLNGDTVPEITYLVSDMFGSGRLMVRDRELGLIWQSELLPLGHSVAVGNVDADGDLEIVTSGGVVYGPDGGGGYAPEWDYGTSFGFQVKLGDLDADGVDEIVGAVDWTAVRVYSAVSKMVVAEAVPAFTDLDTLEVGDIDGDPGAEILVGNGQWGSVYAYSYEPSPTPQLVVDWSISTQDNGSTSLSFGDVDDDGELEFLWGTNLTSTGEDSLVIAGLNPSIGVEWRNIAPSQLDGPFIGGRLVTVAPGRQELIYATASTDSGYAGTRLVAVNPDDGTVTLSEQIGTNWNRQVAIDAADYDGDGVEEVFLATSDYYTPYYVVYDYAAGVTEWSSTGTVDTGQAVSHGDLNGDGHDDFVVITADGYLYAYDVYNNTTLLNTQYGVSGSDVSVADVVGDARPEIVAVASDTVRVYSRSGDGFVLAGSVALADAFDVAVGDVSDDAASEIFVATPSGVTVYDGALSVIAEHSARGTVSGIEYFSDTYGTRLALSTVEDTSMSALVYASIIVEIEPLTGEELSWSDAFPGVVAHNSLQPVDTNLDGFAEYSFGTQWTMNVRPR